MNSKLKLITLDRIKDPERPIRSNLTPESVDELVFSIKEVGLIQPITVVPSGDMYEVVAGHRRLLACEIAQMTEVPCIVVDVSGMDLEVLKMHENIAREEINPTDWAKHIAYLKSQYKISNEQIASILHFSVPWVEQHLKILEYPEEVYEAVENGKLAFTAARELASINDPVKRKVYVNAAVRAGVSPAQAAQWRRQANTMPEQPVITNNDGIPETSGEPVQLITPLCPVCGNNIMPEDQMILTIHRQCAPEPAAKQ